MTELENYIYTYFGVPKEDVEKIASCFTPIQLKKGSFFLKAGRQGNRLAFLQSGITREFIILPGGKEITKWISSKGYFVVDLASFVFQQPARWNIEAITDCELFIISQDAYENINTFIPAWAYLEKLFIAKCFAALEDRVITHLSMTAEERYHALLQQQPHLVNKVPLQYLASMLGMAAETLSRLRRKDTPSIS